MSVKLRKAGGRISEFQPNEEETHDVFTLSTELDARISKILNEESQTSYTTILKIKETFPTEESIETADQVLKDMKSQIGNLDEELRQLVKLRSHKDTSILVSQIKSEIKELINTVQVIKQKAANCENTVMEITRDIKSLDGTKKNLSRSLTVLQQIHLAVNGLDYIKGLANRKQYSSVAEILKPLLTVANGLKLMTRIPEVESFMKQLSDFQVEIKKLIFHGFQGAFAGGTLALQAAQLNESCLVLELLDEVDAKNALCRWYIEMILVDYRNLFQKNPEVAGLADISRRFAWLKRMLKQYDDLHAFLFPNHWKLAELLSWQFCMETKKDLAEVLMKSEKDGTFDTRVMLAAIQTTIEFEGKLQFRFVTQGREKAEIQEVDLDKFTRIISSVFDSFLWHYINMEDQVLTEKFTGFRKSLGEIEDGIFNSAAEMFLTYRQIFANCAKLSTGKPFLDLCKMYSKWLDKYRELLVAKLPKDERKIPTDEDLISLCTLIATADYCSSTTTQLEEKLIETINKEFATLVSFTADTEGFIGTASTVLLVLVRCVENSLDAALIAMTKMQWSAITSVGDQSGHISTMGQTLSTIIPVVRRHLTSPKFFKSFCDKFVESFLAKYLNTIYTRCKPLSEVGAEQLLLDTHSLSNILTAMTMIGLEEKSQPPASFLKILRREIGKIDQLLKVVLRAHDPPGAFVDTYLVLFPSEHSAIGLQKILELKGAKRSEISQIIDMYQKKLKISK